MGKKNKPQINGDQNGEQKTVSPISKKQKRKSLNADDSVKGKKQKIEKFPGTKALQTDDSKSPKKKKEKVAANVKVEEASAEGQPKKLSKRTKKRLKIQMHKARVTAVKEKLTAGGNEATELAKQLKAIVDEKQPTNDLKFSITAAKKLLYFHKHGEDEKFTGISKNQRKKNRKKLLKEGVKPVAGGDEDDKDNAVQPNKQKKKNKKLKQDEGAKETASKKKKNKNKKLKQEDDKKDDDSDYDVETTITVDKVTKKMNDESVNSDDDGVESNESDDGDDSEVDDESEDDTVKEEVPKKEKPKKISAKQNLQKEGLVQKGQSRYVLFVGNIPFDASIPEIKEHFAKVCEVKHVRMPLEKGTNKPRGFAYVELSNEASYQKGLSLHHSMMKNRRINVMYTQGGKKKGEDSQKKIKEKNFKLHAMRKKGILTTDVPNAQKKAARKAKRKHLQPKQKPE